MKAKSETITMKNKRTMHVVLSGSKAVAVYNDALLPLFEALGMTDAVRVSNVEYDPAAEQWVAELVATGEVIARHQFRDECLKLEVEYIERRLHEVR